MTKVDNINLFKLLEYMKQSEISKKLLGFSNKYAQMSTNSNINISAKKSLRDVVGVGSAIVVASPSSSPSTHVSAMSVVEAFIDTLTNADKDGRLLILRAGPDADEPKLKYVLLNPAAHFADIISQARAVIIAGGTMSPLPDLLQHISLAGARPKVGLC